MFKGPVARTKKMTETGPNVTNCNWTSSCGCSVLGSVRLLVSSYISMWKNQFELVATGLFMYILIQDCHYYEIPDRTQTKKIYSAQVEEIDYEMKEYEDMLAADQEFEEWNKEELEDKFCFE